MTDCPNVEIRDQLPDFVHDQLSATARAAVVAHAATCAACAAELALLRELRSTLRSGPAVDVGRIVAALPAPTPTGGPQRRSGGRRVLNWRIAAAVAALVAGGSSAAILGGRLRDPDANRSAAVSRTPAQPLQVREVATAAVSIDADLADASVVELEALLEELEAFDGLPAGEPEAPASAATGEEGL
jgi:anti-sigma factor RsiW